MRKTNQLGVDLIKSFEGFEPETYLDIVGVPTIGYGHVLLPGETFPDGISEVQAEEILCRDLYKAEKTVLRNVNVPLTDNQFAALVSFVFNLGGSALQRSTLRQKLNRLEYEEAANEFRKWVMASGKKIKGLIRRREAERSLFLLNWDWSFAADEL